MSQYPLVMTHPNFVAATVADEAEGIAASPAINPPVIVNDPDQEAQQRAKGYFAMGEITEDYTYQEYPKWVDDETLVSSAKEEAAWKKKQAKVAQTVVDDSNEGGSGENTAA